MATVKCPLKKRGRASREWHDGKKYHIYCMGYIDKGSEELLPECKACADHVNKAGFDLDEEIRREGNDNR